MITVTWSRKYDGCLGPIAPEREVLLVFIRNAKDEAVACTVIYVKSRVSIWYDDHDKNPGPDMAAKIVERCLELAAADPSVHHGKIPLRTIVDD